MSTSNLSSKSAGAGLLAAIVASVCCITPVISLLAGVGGIAATFSWMEPFRPYLVVLTIAILGFAWFQKLRERSVKDAECPCEDEKPSFWQSKKFLGMVTVFAAVMLAFPSYSHLFYSNNNHNSSILMTHDTSHMATLTVNVKGMTCTGCENHIVHEVNKLDGIKSVRASYSGGNATVSYITTKVKRSEIVAAINNTGYTVVNSDSDFARAALGENISFFEVPLVCNAAPSIGCGSRSKPVLLEFEKSELVKEAWLNRQGTAIAVVWNEEVDQKSRKRLSKAIFDYHGIKAKTLPLAEGTNTANSFAKRDGWYKGTDVNKLSKEEAEIIANQLMKPVKVKVSLSTEKEIKLRTKIEDEIYDFFLHYESLEELGDANKYKTIIKGFIDYGETIVGEGKMPSLDELWNACANAAKSPGGKSCSSSCCSAKKS